MMSKTTHEMTPYLIRGSKGIPVGVVPHVPTTVSSSPHRLRAPSPSYRHPDRHERMMYNHGECRSKKSSVMKATAVRKTATMKKKKLQGANTINRGALDGILSPGDESIWRPLGAFMEKPVGSSAKQHSFMDPPRLSEEVHPMNLQGLFDGISTHEEKRLIPERLQVFVRIRPLSISEQQVTCGQDNACMFRKGPDVLAVAPPLGSLACKHGDCDKGQTFKFSRVFGPDTSQAHYFSATAKSMVESLFQKKQGEGVFLSYGITAAGKTFTLQGTKENPGIIQLAFKSLFEKIDPSNQLVEVSFCEIYNESIFDLLRDRDAGPLKLMDGKDGLVRVAGLSWNNVGNIQDALSSLHRGIKQRRRAETKLNYSSSRSHSIFSIQLTKKNGDQNKISFVDLAGSERMRRTENSGTRLKEAVAINSSLMTLGRCLESLRYNQQASKKKMPLKVVPYRESKVTHLFRDALHGYGRLVLSVNVSPSPHDFDETLRVLKYAIAASHISMSCPLHPPKRKLRAETPIGLKRHRLRMEQKRVPTSENEETLASSTAAGATMVHNVAADQSVSIDSRIHEPSHPSASPSFFNEKEINGNKLEAITEDRSISFSHSNHDGSISTRGDESPSISDSERLHATKRDTSRIFQSTKLEKLQERLKVAEKKLVEIEAQVREEVATEMTQIIDNVEKEYKQKLQNELKLMKQKLETSNMNHDKVVENLEGKIASQQMELENLLSAQQELEEEASKSHERCLQSEADVERYKNALNDALSEIERLHVVIEQEELANAKLAASLSEVLREQSSPVSLGSMNSEDDIKLKFKRFKQEVTQIEANNAMEQEMSEHLIDRLKKDNEMLKSKLSDIMHAIDISSSPSKNAIIQNLVAFCPSGKDRGSAGTPHDVALARARRACTEDAENSPRVSRFAKEVFITQEDQHSEEDNEENVELLRTPKETNDMEDDQDRNIPLKKAQKATSRRSSPRKKKTKGDEREEKTISEHDTSRISRSRAREKEGKRNCSPSPGDDDLVLTPQVEINEAPSKGRTKKKLLSTSKSQLSKGNTGTTKILGVSNTGRRTKRALPSASDLGLTPA